MSRVGLWLFWVFTALFLFPNTVLADVTGSFDIDITLKPEGTQTEAVKLFIDLQTNLQLNITFSGLTFGTDLGFGNTGVEFAILVLRSSIGALDIFDRFVFATPFYRDGMDISPTTDSDGNINGPVFVRKEIDLTLNIAGFTLNNIAIFEDTDFPPGTSGSNPIYNATQVNSIGGDQTPSFAFGNVVKISGQSTSGINVEGSASFCANGSTSVKKRSFSFGVSPNCVSGIEGGRKTFVLFEQERVSITGIEIGGVSLDLTTTFRPTLPTSSVATVGFNLANLADMRVNFSSDNITNLSMDMITGIITSGALSITVVDVGANMSIDGITAILSMVLNPNQRSAVLTTIFSLGPGGLNSATFVLSISRGPLSLTSTTNYVGGASELNWASTDFTLAVNSDPMTIEANFKFRPEGLDTSRISLRMDF